MRVYKKYIMSFCLTQQITEMTFTFVSSIKIQFDVHKRDRSKSSEQISDERRSLCHVYRAASKDVLRTRR